MAITSEMYLIGGPYDSSCVVDSVNGFPIGDKAVTSSFVASMISSLITSGVVLVDGSEFSVVPESGLTITINPGCAWMKGYMVRLDNAYTVNLSAGHNYMVVLRQNYGLGECALYVFEDTYGSSPVRFNGVYDLVLAKIKIPSGTMVLSTSMITDTRRNNSYCGLVKSKVPTE